MRSRSHRRRLLSPAVVALLSVTLVGVPAEAAACSPEGTTLTLTDSHNNVRDFSGRSIVNQGTVVWKTAYLRGGHGSTFTFELPLDGQPDD